MVHPKPLPSLICKKHGIYDVFPCPWPNCEHGCTDNNFEIQNYIGKKSTICTRREWKSPSGEIYYSWDSDDLPNWFSADKVVWNEARRQGILGEIKLDTVYHYTTLEGLKGIFDSGELWLSDYSYLNDANEMSHGANLIIQIANEMLKAPEYREATGVLKAWVDGITKIDHRICVASFSSDGDNLSQWRAYGNFAIGFDANLAIGYASETHFSPIEYDPVRQNKFISLYLNHLCQAYCVDNTGGRLARIQNIYHKTEKLIKLITFFKDSRFKDECEYRIAYFEDNELFKSVGLPITPKEFRISHGTIIPYVKSSNLPTPGSSKCKVNIRSVVLGPGVNDLVEQGLREYLDYKGYQTVEIKKSCISYRT